MITGYDSVVVTASDIVPAISRFLGAWARRWPEMLVAIDEPDGSDFAFWRFASERLSRDKTELLIARDSDMLSSWDTYGYEIPGDPEGPLSILYERCPVPTFAAVLATDPYGRFPESNFDPHRAVIVGSGLTLVTLVSPGEDDDFSKEALNTLISSLA